MSDRPTFTGIKDVDRQILLNLNDKSLFSACKVDKYTMSLCNEDFWIDRFRQKFGTTLEDSKRHQTYENFYKKFIKLKLDDQFIEASSRGFLMLIKELIKRGVDINTQYIEDEIIKNGLILAAENGHVDVVKFLLDQGVNIYEEDSDEILSGSHALIVSAEQGHSDVVKVLLDKVSDISDIKESYLRAIEKNNVEVVKLLVDYIDNKTINYSLKIAAEKNYLEIVKFLLDHGVDIINE